MQRLTRSPRLPRAVELAMALVVRRGIEALGRIALGMVGRFAGVKDAADGGHPAPKVPLGSVLKAARGAIAGISVRLGARVQRHSQDEFERLGISLREAEPKFDKLIDEWRDANVERVTSLIEHERDELADILSKGEGKTVEALRRTIEERLDVSRSKADLLARDQVLTLNAQITQERHIAAGIEEYTWTSAGDERVRERHAELDGERFRWDDPPVTNDAGDRNHPGEDYQCRCVAFPHLPELEDLD